jgi:predicted DNA-binding transcriptional regulator YafY
LTGEEEKFYIHLLEGGEIPMKMSKYDRLLYILNLLRTRRNLNAASLAKECGVTERSIYRDIIALSEANVPIYYDNGYKLATDNFLPPLNFDFDEYNCLRMALESSPLAKTGKYAPLLKKVRAKIEANLPQSVKEKRRQTVQTTHIDIEVVDEEEKAERFYGVIEEAVSTFRALELTYEALLSGESSRIIEPYFIVFKGRAFYVVAFCRLRQDFRTFRLDRIKEVKLLTETFSPRQGVSAESYFQGSWQVHGGEPVEVVARLRGTAARVAASGHHHADESTTIIGDGEVEYRVRVRGTEEIKRWLLGFGDEVTVISPGSLRDEFKRTVEEMGLRYR